MHLVAYVINLTSSLIHTHRKCKNTNCFKDCKMISNLLYLWGCIPEFQNGCVDMSNASSAYLGIIAGSIIGGIVSWWIYNRQKKISDSQDFILRRIKELEENHDSILKKLAEFDDKHESSLDLIHELSRKLDSILRNKEEKKDIL
jgi:hypothetical protein